MDNAFQLSRRQFLRLTRATADMARSPLEPYVDADGLTPQGAFYRQQLSGVPAVDLARWSVYVDGFVRRPRGWTADELRLNDWQETRCTLLCAGHSPRNTLIGTARWGGVPLGSLLRQMDVGAGARYVQLTCADGYRTSLPLAAAADVLLALEMNGQPLPPEQGQPLRLIAPGLYGYKMPKWIQQITLTSAPLTGYWEGRGLPEDGRVAVMSLFFQPGHEARVTEIVRLYGAAFAGQQKVARVEVSADDGAWMPARFEPASAGEWVLWQQEWQAPQPGVYALRVRAIDEQGRVQSEGIHQRVVHVIGKQAW
jgi:DMSO/TMAO reductase YedYZ molybdopterin-dependent catalytic subunit